MTPGSPEASSPPPALLASIIIPTYNHAEFLPTAIESALGQTVPCEVIVVDDGSTDGTARLLSSYCFGRANCADRFRWVKQDHAGPSVARNTGIELARAPHVMFLDADDVIAADKVERQLAELARSPEAGWVLCDVQIEDESRRGTRLASEAYGYAARELSGWIDHQLAQGNFIPIMSPLVRRDVLNDLIRFEDHRVPEDWHFWCAVARVARVRYVPAVLATYRHRRTGRSRLPKVARVVSPNITQPLRLNLGCGTKGTRSWHPIDGFVNLDKSMGWRFEDGLGDFADRSVAGISISHTLMYVAEEDWPRVFREFARVLTDDGVVRITEDSTRDRASSRFGGWKGSEPAVTLTSPELVLEHLERAGLQVHQVAVDTTRYIDRSLMQAQHGPAPHVFFCEGVRVPSVLFAPHNDDETLFASFTLLRYRPRVVVCFEGSGDYGDPRVREEETRQAMSVFGAGPVVQWAATVTDLAERMAEFDRLERPRQVWAPSGRTSHPEHLAVAAAARAVFGDRVATYHTYELRDGQPLKVEAGRLSRPLEPIWVSHKLRALARYQSQLAHPRAVQFFTWDLDEYLGEESVT